MADIAGVLTTGEHFSCVAKVVQIAPNQLPHQRRGQDSFRLVPIVWRDCLYLVSIDPRAITGLFDSTKRPVPNNDCVARMTRSYEAVHDRAYHIMMRGEKLPARR